jgi:hypothetical protein
MKPIIPFIILLSQLAVAQIPTPAEQDSALKRAKSIHQEQYEYYKQLQKITIDDFRLALKEVNPANFSTTIEYQLPLKSKIKIDVYNIYGDKIKTIVKDEITEGEHIAIWDNRNADDQIVENGIYLIKFNAEIEKIRKSFQKTVKVLVLMNSDH